MREINHWIEIAGRAASQGRWDDAEQAWRKVLALDPGHAQALYSLGVHAFQRGHLDEALHALRAAEAVSQGQPVVLLAIARVLREQGNSRDERGAIEFALIADPHFLPALLAKAYWLEREGQLRSAVGVYRNALKVAPPETRWPAALGNALRHGRNIVHRFGEQMAVFLSEQTGTQARGLSALEAERWREAGAILAGTSQPYPSICNQLQIPRLPAIPFFDRTLFHWVEALEAQTEAITTEFNTVRAEDEAGFRPYVDYAPGTPVNQWCELNHSQRWSSYKLWDNGSPIEDHLARCPQTAQALRCVEQADIDGMCPNAMFSALAPRTHIPPHTGETNARLVVHLPLIVPDGCSYRVGFEHRCWTVGEVLIFDDSIEHEARNDSDDLRAVLIFDVWNPLLSAGEREMAKALTKVATEFKFEA